MTASAVLSERMDGARVVADLLGNHAIETGEARRLIRAMCPHLDSLQLDRFTDELERHALALDAALEKVDDAVTQAEEDRLRVIADGYRGDLDECIGRSRVLPEAVHA